MSLKDDGLVVIGLDSASIELIRKWREDLPHMNQMMKEGVFGCLKSTIPPFTPPAWTAILTGKNPAKTGIFDWITFPKSGKPEKKAKITSWEQVRGPTLFELLTEEKKKTCAINIPLTYPPRPLEGIMISGIPGHVAGKGITYPRHIKRQLDRVVNGYEILPLVDLKERGKEDEYLRECERVIKKRTQAAKYLLNKHSWDLFMIVYFILDTVQHYFWHHMDPSHPRHSSNSRKYRDVIKHIYQMIDKAIGDFMKELGQDTNLMVVSDHGMHALYSEFMINNFLCQENFLSLSEERHKPSNNLTEMIKTVGEQLRSFHPHFFKRIIQVLPTELVERFSVRGAVKSSFDSLIEKINWEQTKAYGAGEFGQIFLSCQNKEHYYDEIEKKLKEMIEKRISKDCKIYRKADLYDGKFLDRAPDLTYLIDSGHFKVDSHVTQDGKLFSSASLTGYHSPNGVLIASGPDFRRTMGSNTFSIYDVFPTILTLLQVPLPPNIDGNPMKKALSPTKLEKIPKKLSLKKRISLKARRATEKFKTEQQERNSSKK